MAASVLDHDPDYADDPRRRHWYWTHHHWNSYEQDGIHDAPNVDIYLELQGDKLLPVEIKLQFREAGDRRATPTMREIEVYTPDDPRKWMQAKRVARVSAALHAELDVHLAQAHLNMEQYAIAAHRNLRKSPLRPLLMPHLKEVVLINEEASSWLLGENGFITRAQSLTSDAIDLRMRQVLGTLDWKGWQPRQTICKQHIYAIAGKLYWDLVNSYVQQYLIDNEKRLKKHWYEVLRFSNDLVSHSVPLYLCPYLRQRLVDGRLPDWLDLNERMDLKGRPLDNGAPAISRITDSELFENGNDLKNLQQVCSYIIYHATYFHFWPNSKQLDDGGELAYCGLGLRHGNHGIMTDEDDESVLPPPELASEQLWFAHVLSKTRFGFIMANEDRDIPPGFAAMLRSRGAAFQDLLDIHGLPSRLNI